ncbi:large conductance mechanosensitive channel protein MscL [Rarobacter incanus]|uniref:Large-conductance mechanosensitive channel n=1 Tax=Rarobacter incanus TaxID=153494 RepID=A0A542SNV1_9MICO|nr:large conductance mechanosensitive channel [Rarobacter incanus]
MKDILNGFKDFIARGNVVDLAVGVVIGGAFGKVVTALVEGVITPLIAAIFGQPNLDAVAAFTVNKAHFTPGTVLTQALNFLLTALAIYFLIVLPLNKLAERRAAKTPTVEEVEKKAEDVVLLEQIRDLLSQQRPQQ